MACAGCGGGGTNKGMSYTPSKSKNIPPQFKKGHSKTTPKPSGGHSYGMPTIKPTGFKIGY